MCKPSSVAKAIEYAHYVEENLDLKGGKEIIFPQQPRFMGNSLRTFSRGWNLRLPPYGDMVVPRAPTMGLSMVSSATLLAALRTRSNQGHT